MSEYKKQIGALVDAFVTQVAELARTALIAALKPNGKLFVPMGQQPGKSTSVPAGMERVAMSLNTLPHGTPTNTEIDDVIKKLSKKVRKSTKKAAAKAVKKIERTTKDEAREKTLARKKAWRLYEKLRLKKPLSTDQNAWLAKYERKHGKPIAVAA